MFPIAVSRQMLFLRKLSTMSDGGGGGADGGIGRGGRSNNAGRGGGNSGRGRGRSSGRGRGREGSGGARGGGGGGSSRGGRGRGGSGRGGGRGEQPPPQQQQQQQPSQAGNTARGGPGRGPNRNNRANGTSRNNTNHVPPSTNHTPNSMSRPTTTQQQQQLSQAPKRKNGEKGADVHTVFEAERIQFTKILMNLREDGSQTRLEFPPNLTNTERKFVHQLASQLGLTSKSTGKGDARHIVVTKRNANAIKQATAAESKLPRLQVGRNGRLALEQHWRNYPPTHAELLESRETGSSLVEAFTQAAAAAAASVEQEDDDEAGDKSAVQNATLADTLNQLGLGVEQGASRSVQRRAKPVDLHRRRQRHVAAQELKRSNQPDYNQMLQRRAQLPAFRHQEQIVQTVAHHPVTIIQGDTGCGYVLSNVYSFYKLYW
jgi:R3H domain